MPLYMNIPSAKAPAKTTPIAVSIVEAQGSQLHVAVRLEDARFAVWTDRARQLAVAKRDDLVAVWR